MLTSLTKRGGGVSQLLTITDNGWRGGPDPPPKIWLNYFVNSPLQFEKELFSTISPTQAFRSNANENKEEGVGDVPRQPMILCCSLLVYMNKNNKV